MRYQEVSETEILDTQTGLIWRKYVEVGTYTFDKALSEATKVAEETGQPWRVPTVDELNSLVDRSRLNPASTFTDMPPYRFCTYSLYVGIHLYVWVVDFLKGNVSSKYRNDHFALRLVRNPNNH